MPRKIRDKVDTAIDNAAANWYQEYVKIVMEEEKVDYETAWAICQGRTDPPEYYHMLLFKIHPILNKALFDQKPKKADRAAENFAMTLSDPEREIFYSDYYTEKNRQKYKSEKRKQTKEAKKQGGKS